LHSGVLYSNSIFNAGTHNGFFLTENYQWVDKADNWARFAAVASLGVINKGNTKESLNVLDKYLKVAPN
jgi:26S proteasome regulatory subunit N2